MKKFLVILMVLALCVLTFVACEPQQPVDPQPEVTYDANAAVTYVFNLYKDSTTKQEDFEVTATVQVGGVAYDIEWTASEGATVTKKDDKTYTVDIDEKSATGYEFTLTATAKAADGTTAQKEIKFNVPKYEVLSFEQYMAAEADDTVLIEGIVVAINSKAAGNTRNHLFLADANVVGGYYSYQMDADPVADLGIEVGMTVSVSGPVAPYHGMQEIKGGTAKIVDATKKEYAPVDITEAFSTGASLKNYVGLPVTIKGVEIAGQELGGTSDYLKFKLGETISYIRTYVTDFPTTLKAEDKTTIDEAHAAKFGWKANVTGILIFYNSNPYLIPMTTGCFEYLEKIEKTPAQKVQEELDALTIPTFISKDTTLQLPLAGTNYTDVTYAWTVAQDGYTVDAEGKIALTVSSTPVELTFTVTATCGDATATKDITVKVALAKMSIAEALELADDAEVILTGVVTKINTAWSDQYGNISVTIKDATGELYLFRMSTNVNVGDIITVTGKMATYNGARQLAQGSTAVIEKVSTSAEATAAEDGTEVILKGTVTKINTAWSDQYKNITVTITDEAGTFYLYRLSANVEVGDELIVFGKVGSYNGSKQLAQGGTAIIVGKAEGGEGGEGGDEPAPAGKVTIAEALELADGAEVILTGVVTKINTAWSDQYGNISVTIKDATGELYLFRMSTNVNVGDIITVTGKMATYNGARQLAQGSTAVIEKVSTSAEATAAEDGTEVILKGTVTKINTAWSDQYKNITVTITDEAGTFYLYRLSANVEVGDELIVFGKVGSYNGSKQLAQGGTAIIVGKAEGGEGGEGGDQTPEEPVTPPAPVTGNKADFNTFYDGNAKPQYATHTTTAGWTVNNAQIIIGTDEADVKNSSGGIFSFIGGAGTSAAVINGKTSAPGSIVSPTLAGGIKSLSFNYGHPFSEKNGVNITITIKKGGEVVATKDVVIAAAEVAQYTAYSYTWTLDAAVDGEFTIEIANNSPTQSTGNKDRLAVWNLTWENK